MVVDKSLPARLTRFRARMTGSRGCSMTVEDKIFRFSIVNKVYKVLDESTEV